MNHSESVEFREISSLQYNFTWFFFLLLVFMTLFYLMGFLFLFMESINSVKFFGSFHFESFNCLFWWLFQNFNFILQLLYSLINFRWICWWQYVQIMESVHGVNAVTEWIIIIFNFILFNFFNFFCSLFVKFIFFANNDFAATFSLLFPSLMLL